MREQGHRSGGRLPEPLDDSWAQEPPQLARHLGSEGNHGDASQPRLLQQDLRLGPRPDGFGYERREKRLVAKEKDGGVTLEPGKLLRQVLPARFGLELRPLLELYPKCLPRYLGRLLRPLQRAGSDSIELEAHAVEPLAHLHHFPHGFRDQGTLGTQSPHRDRLAALAMP